MSMVMVMVLNSAYSGPLPRYLVNVNLFRPSRSPLHHLSQVNLVGAPATSLPLVCSDQCLSRPHSSRRIAGHLGGAGVPRQLVEGTMDGGPLHDGRLMHDAVCRQAR